MSLRHPVPRTKAHTAHESCVSHMTHESCVSHTGHESRVSHTTHESCVSHIGHEVMCVTHRSWVMCVTHRSHLISHGCMAKSHFTILQFCFHKKSPIIDGSFADRDLQLEASCASYLDKWNKWNGAVGYRVARIPLTGLFPQKSHQLYVSFVKKLWGLKVRPRVAAITFIVYTLL